MKKVFVLIFCFIGSLSSVLACSSATPSTKYEVKDGKVYYQPTFKSDAILVEGANVETFIGASRYSNKSKQTDDRWLFSHYASDIKHVYYKGKALEGADPETATLLTDRLGTVYITEGINRPYEYDGYLKDDKLVFYQGRLLEGADGASLRRVPSYQKNEKSFYHSSYYFSNYVRDQHHIYLYGKKVAGDPKTAFTLHHGYYYDAKHIYFRGKILEGASPNSFKQLAIHYSTSSVPSVFIVSNDRVFYRNDQLPLDASSFEILDTFSGSKIVSCGPSTYAGSLLKDRNGIYILHSNGKLERQPEIDAATFQLIPEEKFEDKRWIAMQMAVDRNQMYYYWHYKTDNRDGRSMKLHTLKISPQKAFEEKLFLDEIKIDTYYKDGKSLHRDWNIFSTWKIQNMEEELGIDAKTFETYATLWKAVVFKDKNMFYLRPAGKDSTELIKLVSTDAKLVCLEKNHLCLLKGNTLYFVFDNGDIKQTQIDARELHCVKGGRLYGGFLSYYSENGVCFDDKQYYLNNGRKQAFSNNTYYGLERIDPSNKFYKTYEYSLIYALTESELEKIRLRSLERIHTERQPFLD